VPYKRGFYDAVLDYAESLRAEKPIVVCGDFNPAHKAIDLARPKANEKNTGFLPEERAWMDRFVAAGYVDTFRHVHGDAPGQYTWWSYKTRARETNVGWRLDYFFVSAELVPAVRDAWIEASVGGSDHCPVGLALEAPE
jgi:exodeoxyribonuclease-3